MAERNETYQPQTLPTQYLRVIGRLYPDLRLRLRPGYLSDKPQWIDREGDSPLSAELINEAGDRIATFPLRLLASCGGESSAGAALGVRGWIPLHPQTRSVRYVYRGHLLFEQRRSEAGPQAAFAWKPPERVDGQHRVKWKAEHPEGSAVQSFLRYSHDGGQTWIRIGGRTEAGEQTVDFDQLPGGERCLLALVATDGINTHVVESEPFRVAEKACYAMILGPLDGANLPAGQPVHLEGQGFWLEEARTEREALEWISSVDGEIGRGAAVEAVLSPGRHTLTLLAGHGQRKSKAGVRVTVGVNTEASFSLE
jgi:hypothetical protein